METQAGLLGDSDWPQLSWRAPQVRPAHVCHQSFPLSCPESTALCPHTRPLTRGWRNNRRAHIYGKLISLQAWPAST